MTTETVMRSPLYSETPGQVLHVKARRAAYVHRDQGRVASLPDADANLPARPLAAEDLGQDVLIKDAAQGREQQDESEPESGPIGKTS